MSVNRRAVLGGIAAVASGSLIRPARAQVGSASNPLVIATGRFHGFLPAYQLPDRLKAVGITAKIVEFPTATERLEAVAAGYAQVSYAGLTASTILRARGKDVVVVASTNEKGRALVASPDISDVKGLGGKKIGVAFGSIEHITLVATLKKAGLNPQRDTQLVNIPATDQPIAFSSKSLDAFMAFEPWATFGVQRFGGKILAYPYDTAVGAIDSGIETNEKFIAENPSIVSALVKAHIAAVEFYRGNLEAVVKEGVQNYKVPEEIMRTSMNNIELTYALKKDELQALANFLVELGFLKPEENQRIDWSKFVNTSFLS
jgi:ABC-type nitrate/sulfonate/bicarbonate transport system substrate-binding protein